MSRIVGRMRVWITHPAHLKTEVAFLLLVAVILALVYGQVYFATFGFLDDFELLRRVQTESYWSTVDLGLGRPLHGVVVSIVFGAFDSIGDLRFVRLVTLLGMVLCAWAVYSWMRYRHMPRVIALVVAVVVMSLPTFQIYSGWATTVAFPLALLIAGAGGLLSQRVGEAPNRRVAAQRLMVAVGLGIVALLIYQPAGMAFLVVVFADLIVDLPNGRVLLRRIASNVIAFLLAAGIAFLVLQIGTRGTDANSRTNLVSDLTGKAEWFFGEALVNASDPWHIRGSAGLVLLLWIIIAGGLLAQASLVSPRRWGALILVPAGVVAAYVPNLLTQESWAAYRSFVVLSPFIILVLTVALRGYWRVLIAVARPTQWAHAQMMTVACLCAILVGTLFVLRAQNLVSTLVVAPQAADYRALNTAVPNAAIRGGYVLIAPEWYEGVAPQVAYDEFGLPSTSVLWALQPMVGAILREHGMTGDVPSAIVRCEDFGGPSSETQIIDIRRLLTPERFGPRTCGH